MRIVGSGMDVTKITLVNTTANTQKAIYAFGHDLGVGGAANLVDFTSIESLTVDERGNRGEHLGEWDTDIRGEESGRPRQYFGSRHPGSTDRPQVHGGEILL